MDYLEEIYVSQSSMEAHAQRMQKKKIAVMDPSNWLVYGLASTALERAARQRSACGEENMAFAVCEYYLLKECICMRIW